ncbi:ERCC4 domain-containing protein [Opitutus sp. ER46]|uniref:ERCC4 domain-containing protein n=1 Tax=Opitutus sp. ER46 TaxID=2161864 RepID=UPI000D321FDE|nr:ERCC4 domain-containing protein [Opitutus sp. ER46]PTX91052.1 nuclease [Opitutus sp. ER46]
MSEHDGKVRVVADDRERRSGVLEELEVRDDVELRVERLRVGDYLVAGSHIVERKTLGDFAISVVDGRWFRQVAALSALRSHGEPVDCAEDMGVGCQPVVILEGTAATMGQTGVRREALQGALITGTVLFGVPVLRSQDAAETGRLLVQLGRQAMRCASGVFERHGYRPKGRRARQLFVLQGLPGVGVERAEKLLDAFGSVQRVAAATAEELAAVPGMGKATAARMRWILE